MWNFKIKISIINLNPFTATSLLVILLNIYSSYYASVEFCIGSTYNPLTEIFLYLLTWMFDILMIL